jgi:hypothetical protein
MDKAHVKDVLRAMDKKRLRMTRRPEGTNWDRFKAEQFDSVDCFLLENWRCGLVLRDKPPRKAVQLIKKENATRQANGQPAIYSMSSVHKDAVAAYVQRRKRLGLTGHRKARKSGPKKV